MNLTIQTAFKIDETVNVQVDNIPMQGTVSYLTIQITKEKIAITYNVKLDHPAYKCTWLTEQELLTWNER